MNRRRDLALGTVLVLGAAVVSARLHATSDSPPVRTSLATERIPDVSHVDGPHVPEHCGGKPTTPIAEAARADYSIFMPNVSMASEETLSGTYRCGDGGTRLEFDAGLFVYVSSSGITDPAKAWSELVATMPDIYSVAIVQGVPAFLSDPAKDPASVAEGGVVAVLNGDTYVAVIGNGQIPLLDLVSVAESLVEIR